MKNRQSNFQPIPEDAEKKAYSIRVWDIPTRLFHWLLVAFVVFSFITGKIGGTAMKYHEWSGFAIMVLVVFRLVWGFTGGEQSRFFTFVKGPATVIRYASSLLRKATMRHIGHNPLGGWSIIAMLMSLLIQAGTGLFANDDILTEGPLFDLVSKKTSDWLTGIHLLNQKVLLVLVVIHICAVFFYLLAKGENLIKPMITGSKIWHQNHDSSWGNPVVALVVAGVVAIVALVVVY
ncbi:MAG: cytochrome b/b6 domain-containing protein [Desulfobacterales bacterium]|nr:MAG: cytochrome b/b6 domain-containing protein [Desulfobacterales bacterium]